MHDSAAYSRAVVFSATDRNVFEMTEKTYVISVTMPENIGQLTLLWRVLMQL